MIHQLKTEAQYFEDVIRGKKSFEVRKNDRGFAVGDFLALNELTPHECNVEGEHLPTGRCCIVEIVYVLNDERFVKSDYILLGIRPCAISRARESIGITHDLYSVPVYEQDGRAVCYGAD